MDDYLARAITQPVFYALFSDRLNQAPFFPFRFTPKSQKNFTATQNWKGSETENIFQTTVFDNNPLINFLSDTIQPLDKSIILLDTERLEKRAKKINPRDWEKYIDWMAFQIARDKKLDGVIYIKNGNVDKMAGFAILLIDSNHIKVCDTGLTLEAERKALSLWLESQPTFTWSYNPAIPIQEINASAEIWAFQIESGFQKISNLINSEERVIKTTHNRFLPLALQYNKTV